MKIVHICLCGPYNDNWNYQENQLSKYNIDDNNEVTIITSTFVNSLKHGGYESVEPRIYFSDYGVKIIRLPLLKLLPSFINKKIRIYKDLYKHLSSEKPDVILVHGLQFADQKVVVKYKKENPELVVYADNHADYNNSATNFVSRNILHKVIYRYYIKKSMFILKKIFYLSLESKIFLDEMYGINDERKIEFYPLGGVVIDDSKREQKRNEKRDELGVTDSDILLIHSGKLTVQKRTKELIEAFNEVNRANLKLVIIGSISEENKDLKEMLSVNPKVDYLGWKESEELLDYLCASDLYVQPGSQSATMQNALCCGSAAMLFPHKSHKHLLGDSVFYIEGIDDMTKLFRDISDNPDLVKDKRKISFAIAKEKLDYKVLAARLYE